MDEQPTLTSSPQETLVRDLINNLTINVQPCDSLTIEMQEEGSLDIVRILAEALIKRELTITNYKITMSITEFERREDGGLSVKSLIKVQTDKGELPIIYTFGIAPSHTATAFNEVTA